MRYLKTFKSFQESLNIDLSIDKKFDISESLSVWQDSLLDSIKAEEVDIFSIFKLDKKDYNEHIDIENLSNDPKFIKTLLVANLKKMGDIQNTEDFETFLKKSCKFLLIYDKDANDLQNPLYLLLETFNEEKNKWNSVKLYKVNDDMKKFYDKLSSKTVELIDKNDKNYIYKTSNSGNNWELQNINNETPIFKKSLSTQDLKQISKKQAAKLNII
jgi:hypothetical protein